MHEIRKSTKIVIVFATIAAFIWRGYDAIVSLSNGAESPVLAFPLTVIFPTLLIAILLLMKPTRTREGLLMRFGTAVQLILILCIPHFALYLALGFPFVFLMVELFETRLPQSIRAPLSKLVLS